MDGIEMRDGPVWGMSLKAAGSMRFRWNETNPNRDEFLSQMRGPRKLCQVELIHSHIVMAVDSPEECANVQADGIITTNRQLFPVITVADCMPIFLFEPKSGVFGVLHSGWKGTGIVKDAVLLAQEKYGADPKNFSVVMGPHIHECCYNIDQERADYFTSNFGKECVKDGSEKFIEFRNEELQANGNEFLRSKKVNVENKPEVFPYTLSLAKANLHVIKKLGISENNIAVSRDCTCCNEKFGSFRRQFAAEGSFTVQAAWVKW